MKALVASVLLLFLAGDLCLAPPISAPQEGDSMRLAGRNYLRLAAWARANNLEIHWLKRDKNLTLTGRLQRLAFEVDSRDTAINGVNVKLSFPVVLAGGTAWVSQIDADATLKPALIPPRNSDRAKVHTIVLDPGHGGKDPGFQEGSQQEKKYALLLALELTLELRRAGFSTSLTRSTDVFIERGERVEIASRRHADLFISLHWNSVSGGKNDAKGAQTYCLTPAGAPSSNDDANEIGGSAWPGNRRNEKNFLLAYDIQKALKFNLGAEDRGVLRARFEVLRTAEMPSVLIEGGFMSHPVESKHIYDAVYRKQMARAIAAGVLAYKAQVEREPDKN